MVWQVARTEAQCLFSLWVKHNSMTLPLLILIMMLQKPSPKTMVVSSPHTMATSTLMSHRRQEAMRKPIHKSTLEKQLASFLLEPRSLIRNYSKKIKRIPSFGDLLGRCPHFFQDFWGWSGKMQFKSLNKRYILCLQFPHLHWVRTWKKWLEL